MSELQILSVEAFTNLERSINAWCDRAGLVA
jgi:hypothetical protein